MAAKRTTTDFAGYAPRVFEPATRLNAVVLGHVERVARFQYECAGDLLQLGLDQLQATTGARDLPTLLAHQREIATRFAARAQDRQKAFGALAAESQASFTGWIEETTASLTGKPE